MSDASYVPIAIGLYAVFIIVLIVFTRRMGRKLSRIESNTGALPGIRDKLSGMNERLDAAMESTSPDEMLSSHPPSKSDGSVAVVRNDWGVFDWEGDWMVYRVSEEQARATFAANEKRAWTLVKNIRFDGISEEETYTVVERRESMFDDHTQPLLRTR